MPLKTRYGGFNENWAFSGKFDKLMMTIGRKLHNLVIKPNLVVNPGPTGFDISWPERTLSAKDGGYLIIEFHGAIIKLEEGGFRACLNRVLEDTEKLYKEEVSKYMKKDLEIEAVIRLFLGYTMDKQNEKLIEGEVFKIVGTAKQTRLAAFWSIIHNKQFFLTNKGGNQNGT